VSNEWQIKDEGEKYTPEFIELMRDYYLFENIVLR